MEGNTTDSAILDPLVSKSIDSINKELIGDDIFEVLQDTNQNLVLSTQSKNTLINRLDKAGLPEIKPTLDNDEGFRDVHVNPRIVDETFISGDNQISAPGEVEGYTNDLVMELINDILDRFSQG